MCAGLVTVSNATRLPVTEREPFGEQRGCFAFFFPPPNDKCQCFPDMTHISKTDVLKKAS